MRLTVQLGGFELDLTFGPATAAEDQADEPDAALNGGTLAAYPVGFTAAHDTPDMVGLPPDRSNGWPDEDGRR